MKTIHSVFLLFLIFFVAGAANQCSASRVNSQCALILQLEPTERTFLDDSLKAKESLKHIEGIYYLTETNEDTENVLSTVSLKLISTNKLSINSDFEYEFEREMNGDEIVLTFGAYSEESGDYLGGGKVEIKGDLVQVILLNGPEANFRSVYSRKKP